jgi:hypothetical protein
MSRTRPGFRRGWPLERVLFALAGTVTLASAALAALVSPWFPASVLLIRLFGLQDTIGTPPTP